MARFLAPAAFLMTLWCSVLPAAEPPPCKPLLLTEDVVSLTWVTPPAHPQTTITGVLVFRKESDGPWVNLATLPPTVTDYLDTIPTLGTTYEWTVQIEARLSDGRRELSALALHGTPAPCAKLVELPANLTVTAHCAPRTVRLAWESTAPTRQIRVQHKLQGTPGFKTVVTTTGEHYLAEEVDVGTCFRIGYSNQQAWTSVECVTP